MAGMELLGRTIHPIPIAAGKPFKMRGASSVAVLVTGAAAVVTVNERLTFGGADVAVPLIRNVYWSTAADGTTSYSKLIMSPQVSTYTHGTTAGLTTATYSVFHVFTSQLSDPYAYLNIVVGGSGLACVILGDLVAQRGPTNLEILGS
jgi:hypothetical protein